MTDVLETAWLETAGDDLEVDDPEGGEINLGDIGRLSSGGGSGGNSGNSGGGDSE